MFATLLGDPKLINEQADRYNAVTADRVDAFAQERLGPDNRAKLLYIPRAQDSSTPSTELAEAGFATVHPSSILRAPSDVRADAEKQFVDDLKKVARYLAK